MPGTTRRPRHAFTRAVIAASVAAVAALGAAGAVRAQDKPADKPPEVRNSDLDATLFYQLLIGEIELRSGRAGNAYEVMLDAARREGDEALYQRAVEIALQARAGEQALSAAQAWRAAKPQSVAPLRFQMQILMALNRTPEAMEPLGVWLALSPVMERPGLIAGVPRLLQRLPDKRQALSLADALLAPYRDEPATRTAAQVSLGRMHLAAGDTAQALGLARSSHAADAAAPGPVLLALDMLPATPAAESVVADYLRRGDAEAEVRLAYVRTLIASQRYGDAMQHLELVTVGQPKRPDAWLMLGALRVELKQPREAEDALQRYLVLAGEAAQSGASPHAAAEAPAAGADKDAPDESADAREDDESAGPASAGASGAIQAWLLLAQAAEMRGDLKAAERWLAKVDNPQRALEVQSRRASLLARQGRLKEARALIQAVPERTGEDARAKLLAEAQLLRDAKQWREAAGVYAAAVKRFPDDTELLYEQAMVEEKREHFADMEKLLRRVIELKPDHAHAHNALGYSMADRGVRLPEARDLIRRALDLAPGDPFITDSLGWAEFRLGNRDEAIRLLRSAYAARPDTEIAAHLGEVLWSGGRQDEARQVWREARGRDASNEVLRETLARLKVGL